MFESITVPAEEPDDAFGVEAWRLAVWAVEDAVRAGEPVVVPDRWDEAFGDPYCLPSSRALLAEVCGQEPGAAQLLSLAGVDVAGLSADDAVTFLQQVRRASAWIAGFETGARKTVTERVVLPFSLSGDLSGS